MTHATSSANGGPATAVRRPGMVLLLASAGTFIAFLDVTVVHVAFPDLQRSFAGTSLTSLSWVVTAYAVAFAALLTPAGRLADVLGRRRVFLAGVAVFTLASLANALAPSVPALIAARTVQGLAGATMVPAALGLVLAAMPAARRARAIGAWGAAASVAAATGPPLGGLLVQAFDWRAVFLVNLPVGAAVIVAGLRTLPEVRQENERLPDLAGTALVAVGLGALVVGLTKAGDWGWTAPATLACVGAGLVLAAIAIARARRHAAPAVETSLWSSRMFAAANLTVLAFGAAVYSWMLLCIIFLTSAWGYDIFTAGLAVTHGALASAVGAGLTGRVADWRRRRVVVIVAALALLADAIWLHQVLTTTPNFVGIWLPGGIISGLAIGAVLTALASAAATSIPAERFAAGTGMEMTGRELGGAIGVAALAAIISAGGGTFDAVMDVWLFAGAASLVAAIAALRLSPGGSFAVVDEGKAPATAFARQPSGT